MRACELSSVCFFLTPWTEAHQTPLSMRFSQQEYWSGWAISSSRESSWTGIKPISPASFALAGEFFILEPPGKHLCKNLGSPKYPNALEEGMATHSSIPPGESSWTEEPGRLQSMGYESYQFSVEDHVLCPVVFLVSRAGRWRVRKDLAVQSSGGYFGDSVRQVF